MSNLIITIISITLVAVAAIMGAYYGGKAYYNAQINAAANAIINEAQQILQAERIWSTINNQPDISGMGTAGASGTGMSALINSKILAEWPAFGGTLGLSVNLTNPGPQPYNFGGDITKSAYDSGCYSINGYVGKFVRFMFSYNSQNYVAYSFGINVPYNSPCTTFFGVWAGSITDTSEANHPIVLITKAINAALNQISPSANTGTIPYVGLPYPPTGGALIGSAAYDTSGIYASTKVWLDANGTVQTNYCFLSLAPAGNPQGITCVFGPS